MTQDDSLKSKVSSPSQGDVVAERYSHLRKEWERALEKLERLQSGKELASFAGKDYTQWEIANLLRELDWYEKWFEENAHEIRRHLPSQRPSPPRRFVDRYRTTVPANPARTPSQKDSGALRPPAREEQRSIVKDSRGRGSDAQTAAIQSAAIQSVVIRPIITVC